MRCALAGMKRATQRALTVHHRIEIRKLLGRTRPLIHQGERCRSILEYAGVDAWVFEHDLPK